MTLRPQASRSRWLEFRVWDFELGVYCMDWGLRVSGLRGCSGLVASGVNYCIMQEIKLAISECQTFRSGASSGLLWR